MIIHSSFGKWLAVMYSIHDLQLMRENMRNHWAWVRACQTNHVFWVVTSQPLGELRVSQHMLSSSLAAPQLDLLRPRAQWRPQLWARCWTPCCSYRSAWCCCHCRRILSGKAGREICAKTRRQATLYDWTHTSEGSDSSLNQDSGQLHQKTLSTGRHTEKHTKGTDRQKSETVTQTAQKLPADMYSSYVSHPVFKSDTDAVMSKWAKINKIKSVEINAKIKATSLF